MFPRIAKQVFAISTKRERRNAGVVLLLLAIVGVFEALGAASIMPFLAVIGDPDLVTGNKIVSTLHAMAGQPPIDAFQAYLVVFSIVILVSGATFRTVANLAMRRFIEMRRHSLGQRLLETYLRQPYSFFLDRHSGDLAKNILSEVDQVIEYIISPIIALGGQATVILAIIALLIIVDPAVAAVVGLAISAAYGLIYLSIRGTLGRHGRDRAIANGERFTAASEALAGVKEIKLLGREQAYLSRFANASLRHARHRAMSLVLGEAPRYAIEAIAFGGILLLALYLTQTGDGLGETLPLLGLYAFSGYRLLPAVQHVFAGATRLRFGAAALAEIHTELILRRGSHEIQNSPDKPLAPRASVALRNVSFRYTRHGRPAISDLCLEIAAGETVGIVGETGAGKTTAVDLLLGLLEPTEGRIEIDGMPLLPAAMRAWQNTLGYVPQTIFLADATVAENIAFGMTSSAIDLGSVERAARLAHLHDFVVRDLPKGYDTVVGERGVRLSGGQRQRIGIARALYHDPSVLVFDEATSALDNATEGAILEAVGTLHGRKTIIMIAHRLSTVANCDCIYVLKQGRLVAHGTFDQLLRTTPELRRLARS